MSEVDSAEPKPLQPSVWAADGLDVKIAAELLERARAEGVSLVGQAVEQVIRAVLQEALEAEMADNLGYERGAGGCTDPTLVGHWIAQVQVERALAEQEQRSLAWRRVMTAIYREADLKLTYEPARNLIKAEADPSGLCTKVCPRGIEPPYVASPRRQ